MKNRTIIALIIMSIFLLSCSGISYNKVYLSDEDMKLGSKSIQKTEISATSYREGASGADGGDSGGGCGCN